MRRSRTTIALLALALAAAAGSGTYTVQRGDTLSAIARRNSTTVRAIASANGIADPDRIYVGQTLAIPGSAEDFHIVRAGETLASIARAQGTTVEELARANGITNVNRIYAGTRLQLAAAAALPVPAAVQQQIHLVRPGETLSGIARRFGTSAAAITQANGIADPDLIVVGTPLSVPSTGFVCPVPGAAFFNDFGFARAAGRFHEGNDLFAPHGSEVLASVGGHLEQYAGPIGGLQFRLRADDGTTYIGTHLSGYAASGRVAAGQLIGYVGDTGNAAGSRSHLHFEIIPEGSGPVNPYPLLEQACRR